MRDMPRRTAKDDPKPEVEVRNPRYAGATPEMVARALMRPSNRSVNSPAESVEVTEPGDDAGDFQSAT